MESGIYRITNTLNSKYYIGRSVNMHKRFIQHLCGLRNNTHKNPHLQNSYNLYGEEVFFFEKIFFHSIQGLKEIEQSYLDAIEDWNTVYNLVKTADGGWGGKLLSKEVVIDIFDLYNNGWIMREIGDEYGISQETVSRILRKDGYNEYSINLFCDKNRIPKTHQKRDGQIKWLSKFRTNKSIANQFNLTTTNVKRISKLSLHEEIPCPDILEKIPKDNKGKFSKKH
jgi:GIY-YIG catalytic domain